MNFDPYGSIFSSSGSKSTSTNSLHSPSSNHNCSSCGKPLKHNYRLEDSPGPKVMRRNLTCLKCIEEKYLNQRLPSAPPQNPPTLDFHTISSSHHKTHHSPSKNNGHTSHRIKELSDQARSIKHKADALIDQSPQQALHFYCQSLLLFVETANINLDHSLFQSTMQACNHLLGQPKFQPYIQSQLYQIIKLIKCWCCLSIYQRVQEVTYRRGQSIAAYIHKEEKMTKDVKHYFDDSFHLIRVFSYLKELSSLNDSPMHQNLTNVKFDEFSAYVRKKLDESQIR